jgi:hypothetical protein
MEMAKARRTAQRFNRAAQQRIARYYTEHGFTPTLKHFNLQSNAPLYTALRKTNTPVRSNGTGTAAASAAVRAATAAAGKVDMGTLVLARKLQGLVVAQITAKGKVGPLEFTVLALLQHLLPDDGK